MRFTPISSAELVRTLTVSILDGNPTGRVRVGIDGPAALAPEELAAALIDPLRAAGRPALAVSTAGFVRPASTRLELGRTNPDSYYESWFDLAALSREVLDPLAVGGSGRVLPSLWDVRTDRATRAAYLTAPPDLVLLLAGPLLLGAGLALDLTVHLLVTPAALARRTPADLHWTLPAFERYAAEVAPENFADVVVRYDDPDRPAIRTGG